MRFNVSQARRGWQPGQPHPGYAEHDANGQPTGVIHGGSAIPDTSDRPRYVRLLDELRIEMETLAKRPPPAPEPTLSDMVERFGFRQRFLLRFDWHYGAEEIVVDDPEQATRTIEQIREDFKGFVFTNVRIVETLYHEIRERQL